MGYLVLCLGLLVAVFAATAAQEPPLPWWKTATLYQVYPRSFQDTDGDGTGDLKGITQRADYFKEIGVDAIWISPIFKSPMVDNGYDISDFRDIDPLFGTLGDFKELVAKLKSLDIKLLLDMVPNHSSDQHEWFKKSLNKEDPYTDYFVWNDGKIDPVTGKRVPPNNWKGLFSGLAWEWRDERKQYYLHQFTPQQIDLNYRNSAVLKEMDDMMTFWLDLGIDGFRMDAVIFLWEHDYNMDEPQYPGTSGQTWFNYNHTQTLCQPEDIQIQNHWNELVYNYSKRDGNGKQRAIFVEAYARDSFVMQLYGHGNTSFTSPFNFKLLQQGNQNLRAPQIRDIMKGYLALLSGDQTPNWVIGNHDNMRLANRYGPEAVDAMGMLLGVLPGVKVVYNGEEIGMQDTYIRPDQNVDPGTKDVTPETQSFDRDPPRTPMQWDDSIPNAGFSSAIKTWLPVNPNYWWLNVDAQRQAEKSHLKVFQDVSRVRKDPVLQRGTTDILAPNNDTLVVIRSYNGTFYVYIFNIGNEIINVTLQYIATFPVTASVEVASINSKLDKGTLVKSSDTLTLRPKAAVILRSPPSTSSASPSLGVSGLIILPFMLLHFTVDFLT